MGNLTLVGVMLAVASTVVVPLALPLLPGRTGVPGRWAVVAGAPVVPAVLVDQGLVAAVLAAPWLVLGLAVAASTLTTWWHGPRDVRGLVWPVAGAYLVVGAAWLVADRAGMHPVGVAPPLVALTGVHFHYAGFASAVLVGCAVRALPGNRAAPVAAVATVGAPPLVAIGFTWYGALQVLGAVVLSVGLWTLAWLTLRHVVPTVRGAPRWLLGASAISVVVPMLLAVQWAVGVNVGTPALSIPDMARTHGVVNGLGFALLGILGWRRLGQRWSIGV